MTEAPPQLPTTFTDSQGRTWTLRLTAPLVKMVRSSYEIDLVDFEKPDWLLKLSDDVVLFAELLWTLCEREASVKRVELVDFADAVNGDTLDRALTALQGAIVDFFPSSRRPIVVAALAKLDEAFAETVRRATETIRQLDVNELLPPIPSPSATNSQGVSAWTQPDSPSVSSPACATPATGPTPGDSLSSLASSCLPDAN